MVDGDSAKLVNVNAYLKAEMIYDMTQSLRLGCTPSGVYLGSLLSKNCVVRKLNGPELRYYIINRLTTTLNFNESRLF